MITFLLGIAGLVLGYVIYGAVVDKIFKPSSTFKTPAMKKDADGVDFVPMNWKKVMLIQFISIAGTGPIFGAIAGALWGPVAYLWIIFGCIFAGAVHDYFSGMLSVRSNGGSVSEVVGKYLGNVPRNIMRVFSIVLLILVGAVFTTTPALIFDDVIASPGAGVHTNFYFIAIAVIIVYYIIATITPINKIIGRIYPAFGILLTFTGVAIFLMLFVRGYMVGAPELVLRNVHPAGTMIFPFLFITIACGAISGFHATQSPLMARCIRNEKEGRKVFYGSMILEGFIAMIWAAAAMTFFANREGGLVAALPAPNVVTQVSLGLLGPIIGTIVIIGVMFFPITSGDTAFRAARLILADSFKFSQKPILNRFILAIPLFVIGIILCLPFVDFDILWRYFAWSNQSLATIVLWAAAAYLAKTGKSYWIALIPATFMTTVVVSFIMIAPIGFRLPYMAGVIGGIVAAAALFVVFVYFVVIKQRGTLIEEERRLLEEGSKETA